MLKDHEGALGKAPPRRVHDPFRPQLVSRPQSPAGPPPSRRADNSPTTRAGGTKDDKAGGWRQRSHPRTGLLSPPFVRRKNPTRVSTAGPYGAIGCERSLENIRGTDLNEDISRFANLA